MSQGMLEWAVKPSLLDYVAALADGRAETADGATGTLSGGFAFPVVERDWAGPGTAGEVRAAGTVVLFGHGMRMFEIRDPRLVLTPEGGVLAVRRWAGRDALLEVGALAGADGLAWNDVALTDAGRELFDFRYEEGEPLSPVALLLPHPG